MVNRRSESPSSAAHLRKESETGKGGTKLDDGKGAPTYIGLPEAAQLPHPFAPDSPNRGCSDSQNCSSDSRRVSSDWLTRGRGTLKALYCHERKVVGHGGGLNSQFGLALKKRGRSFDESCHLV